MPKKMPAQFKACEGCRHFLALYYGGRADCECFGLINNGVVWCRQYEEEKTPDDCSGSESNGDQDA